MARTYTLTLKTLKLRPGQYIIKPDGSIIGRCRVCGEIIHATINHPEPCRIYDCIHCPYRDQNPCPGERALGFHFLKDPLQPSKGKVHGQTPEKLSRGEAQKEGPQKL